MLLCGLFFLTGCAAKNKYINEEEYINRINNANSFNDDFEIYDGSLRNGLCGMYIPFSPDGKMFYMASDTKKIIDLKKNATYSYCDIPGCRHTWEDADTCIEVQNDYNIVSTRSGYYYTNLSGNLYYRENGKSQIVFTNDIYYELEAEKNPDHKTSFWFFIRDGVMYVFGRSYVYLVDTTTWQKITEPIIISDTSIAAADINKNYLWFTDGASELKVADLNSGKTKTIAHKVIKIVCEGDKTYFVSYDNDAENFVLYVTNIDGETKMLVDDINEDMAVFGNNIIYTQKNDAYLYDVNTQSSKKLELDYTYENGEKYQKIVQPACFYISSCPSSKYVYLVDYNIETGKNVYKAVFCINKTTLEMTTFGLQIEYNGKVVSY